MQLLGSNTHTRLAWAFVAKSQLRNRLAFMGKRARKDGFVKIARVLEEASEHERALASRLCKLFAGETLEASVTVRAESVGETPANVDSLIAEYNAMAGGLMEAAAMAREEGFGEAAAVLGSMAKAADQFATRLGAAREALIHEACFAKDTPVTWRCLNCGFAHEAAAAPAMCPACAHPQAHFEVFVEAF